MIKLQTTTYEIQNGGIGSDFAKRCAHDAMIANAYQEALAGYALSAGVAVDHHVDRRAAELLKEWGVENG